METRASYVMVGAFVLVLLVGAAAAVLWLSKYGSEQQFAFYRIYFTGSVSGLQEGGQVRFRGITVGQVARIRIDPMNIERIEVVVRVDKTTPVKTDAVASLELQGITGVSYVQLSGGTQGAALVPAVDHEPYPIVASKPSTLERLFADAPDLVSKLVLLTGEAQDLLNAENRKAVHDTLANVEHLTGTLAAQSDNLGGLIAHTDATVEEVQQTVAAYRDLASDLRSNVQKLSAAGVGSLAEVKTAADRFAGVADTLDKLLAENCQPLRDFSTTGLYEFRQLMAEARVLVESLTRVSQQIERDPTRFLFGDRQKGYEIK